MTNNPLILFAMKEESQTLFDDVNLLHSGIGKINAAYTLTKTLSENRPDLVINLGTAGSQKHPGGAIINPTIFVQRDMDVTALGFEPFQTPFSPDPTHLEYGLRITPHIGGTCGTGDNFDTGETSKIFDVVDMEAYALALICQRENIPFLCLKYISDGADDNATEDWNASLTKAAKALRQAYNDFIKS